MKKKVIEKGTGEKYASKAAMAKHEKKESKAEMGKEYKKLKTATKQAKSPVKMVKSKTAAKAKKC